MKTFRQLTLEEARQLYQLGLPVQFCDIVTNELTGEERWYKGSTIDGTLGPRERKSSVEADLRFRIEVE